MRYLSVCSGVGTDHLAWQDLGWECVGFAELDSFASAILAHRYPRVVNYGDFTTIPADIGAVDLLVGGTPCQSFSVSGRRAGLDDPRGNLTLEFVRLARRLRVRWVVWENVPGVLNSDRGRDFAAILTAFRKCGYSVAYRVLDAQHYGVPQRRRRVFLVGYFGDDWRPSAQVLFEQQGLPRSSDTRGKKRPEVAKRLGAGFESSGGSNFTETMTFVPSNLPSISATLTTKWDSKNATSPQEACSGALLHGYVVAQSPTLHTTPVVRRLTPRECERLQGLPDDWTLVPYKGKSASDTPRYKAVGNGMAMPVLRWLGQRIVDVETTIMSSATNHTKGTWHGECEQGLPDREGWTRP